MPLPDSAGKAPNIFFDVIDQTGSAGATSFVPAPGPRISSITPAPPPPPTIFNARWFNPPDQNLVPVTLTDPANITVSF